MKVDAPHALRMQEQQPIIVGSAESVALLCGTRRMHTPCLYRSLSLDSCVQLLGQSDKLSSIVAGTHPLRSTAQYVLPV